jgi:hypothetical protein
MTVLVIRAHKRYGVCKKVGLRGEDHACTNGLLIEMSLEGCRISNVKPDLFAIEDLVEVAIEGADSFAGHVRWQHDGMIGLRLAQPLHNCELAALIEFCRGERGMDLAKRA